jgi:TonB family protein
MLESGGMIYLEAWEGNQELELAKEIVLKFPTKNYKEGMEVFQGVMKNNIVNWKEIIKKEVSLEVGHNNVDNDNISLSLSAKYDTYPKKALENGIQGIVNVLCEIGKNGEILKISTEGEKLGYGLEEEAIRVVRKMPRTYLKSESKAQKLGRVIFPISFTIDAGGFFGDSDSKNLSEKRSSFEKMLEKKSDSVNISALSLNYYILSSPNLGWINCDRFYDEPRQHITVNLPSESKQSVSIVFTKINSVISQFCLSRKVEFLNIGKNLDATILATKKEGIKNLVSVTKVNTSSKNISINPYQEMTPEELKKLMQSFDN